MSTSSWRETLEAIKPLSVEDQFARREEIVEAVRQMWLTNPTEAEFAEYFSSVVLFPELLYILVKEVQHARLSSEEASEDDFRG